MKKTVLFINFYRGVKLYSIVLSFAMLATLLLTSFFFGRMQYMTSNYDALRKSKLDEYYYVMGMGMDFSALLKGDEPDAIKELKKNKNIKNIFTVKSTRLGYKESDVNVLFYNDKVAKSFPAFLSLDTGNNYTCVIGSELFKNVKTGETINLTTTRKDDVLSLVVDGKLDYPYVYLSLSKAGSTVIADNLFSQGDVVIVRENEELLKKIEAMSNVSVSKNYLISLVEDVSTEEKEQIINIFESIGVYVSVEEIISNTEKELIREFKNTIPKPIFLLIAVTISYFSATLLLYKKKETDLAIYYVCGFSKRRSCALLFAMFNSISFVPFLLCVLFVIYLPYFDDVVWLNIEGVVLDERTILFVFVYYLLTLLLSTLVTFVCMRRYTPVTYIRGVIE